MNLFRERNHWSLIQRSRPSAHKRDIRGSTSFGFNWLFDSNSWFLARWLQDESLTLLVDPALLPRAILVAVSNASVLFR